MTESAALRLWCGAVLDEWIDYNGHMSEGFYGVVFGMASDEYLIRMGFDEHYRATVGGSFYTVETHIVFIDELAPGPPWRWTRPSREPTPSGCTCSTSYGGPATGRWPPPRSR